MLQACCNPNQHAPVCNVTANMAKFHWVDRLGELLCACPPDQHRYFCITGTLVHNSIGEHFRLPNRVRIDQ